MLAACLGSLRAISLIDEGGDISMADPSPRLRGWLGMLLLAVHNCFSKALCANGCKGGRMTSESLESVCASSLDDGNGDASMAERCPSPKRWLDKLLLLLAHGWLLESSAGSRKGGWMPAESLKSLCVSSLDTERGYMGECIVGSVIWLTAWVPLLDKQASCAWALGSGDGLARPSAHSQSMVASEFA
jgi:hypothetical protein